MPLFSLVLNVAWKRQYLFSCDTFLIVISLGISYAVALMNHTSFKKL